MPHVLRPGHNCWTAAAPVDAAGLLIDARAYYRAFYRVAKQARRYLLIAGWRFNSDVRLVRGKDAEENGGEVKLLPFLDQLCKKNPELRVCVLAWDFSMIFAHAWELFQEWKFEHARHGQIDFLFDSNHAVGASHHQKLAIVDGHQAFLGGLDFNADDWDDRRHLADNPLRADSGEEQHHPYHDVQAYFSGPVAKELADYFATRWLRAGGDELKLPDVPKPRPLCIPKLAVRAPQVALSRTEAPTLTDGHKVQEIRQLYLDAIASAEEMIYIENQYFSSEAVYHALLERMRAANRPKLDIALVLPKRLPSLVESVALSPPRIRMLTGLREAAAAHGHRFGAYYPAAFHHHVEKGPDGKSKEEPVVVHSKILIVDDRFLTMGSANTSNRSMALDTELNATWEAAAPDDPLIRSIRRVRVSLLGEHSGSLGNATWRAALRTKRGLVDCLDRLSAEPGCRLRPLTDEAVLEEREWMATLAKWGVSLDPDGPVVEETLFEPLEVSASLFGRGLTWLRDFIAGSPAKRRHKQTAK
jgi:phospholipase D1/2